MSNISKEVFLGNHTTYNALLAKIATFAQPEIWSYGKLKITDPYKILRNYFENTYDKINEENKFVFSTDGQYKCMNTGLLTVYDQEIYAIFQKCDTSQGLLPWRFCTACRDTDKFFSNKFSEQPKMADYFANMEDMTDLIYDKNLEIRLNVNHIVDDNYERFANIGYREKPIINALLNSAKSTLEKKLLRNFKLALPFYYHKTSTNEHKIQLLVPVYFPSTPVKLSFVLDKQQGADQKKYYEAITVLPVECAYMNSRLIVRPDEEWAKIIEEVDNVFENENKL